MTKITQHHRKHKICRFCKTKLEIGVNWTIAAKNNSRYLCNNCHSKYTGNKKYINNRNIDKNKKRDYDKKNYKLNKKKIKERSKRYYQTINGRYKYWINSNKKRGIGSFLTIKEYSELVTQPCYYCGEINNPFNGIDRIDSNGDYTKDNCVPCCSTCNYMKHTLSMEDFLSKIECILEKQTIMKRR
jgi:ribosomal protein L31